MTEVEKIQYTKSFIDKLAQGIDPISGRVIPENEIIRQVRISRCLHYVSEILEQVIRNGGTSSKKKLSNREKKPFFITDQQLEKYPYSDIPVSVSEIARNINTLIDTETMRSISYKDITAWLIQVGALQETENKEGKRRKYPTAAGKDLGITCQERDNGFRTYQVILYDKSAQQLIIDNMALILDLKRNAETN